MFLGIKLDKKFTLEDHNKVITSKIQNIVIATSKL